MTEETSRKHKKGKKHKKRSLSTPALIGGSLPPDCLALSALPSTLRSSFDIESQDEMRDRRAGRSVARSEVFLLANRRAVILRETGS